VTRTEIEARIGDTPYWQQASEPQRDAFCCQMMACQYGREPLRDAWAWFTVGWEAGQIHAAAVANQQRVITD
jgi:hypothetical protein